MRLTIRPSSLGLSSRRQFVRGAAGVLPFLALGVLEYFRESRHDSSFVWLGPVVVVGIFVPVVVIEGVRMWLYQRNATLFTDGTEFGKTDLWGRETVAPVSDLKCVQLGSRSKRNGVRTLLVPTTDFVSSTGTVILQTLGRTYSRADLQRLCDEMHTLLVGSWPD